MSYPPAGGYPPGPGGYPPQQPPGYPPPPGGVPYPGGPPPPQVCMNQVMLMKPLDALRLLLSRAEL